MCKQTFTNISQNQEYSMAYCKLISQADLVSSYVDNTATKTGEKVS